MSFSRRKEADCLSLTTEEYGLRPNFRNSHKNDLTTVTGPEEDLRTRLRVLQTYEVEEPYVYELMCKTYGKRTAMSAEIRENLGTKPH